MAGQPGSRLPAGAGDDDRSGRQQRKSRNRRRGAQHHNPGIISFTQITGVAARRLGYCIGFIIIVAAFLPKVSGLIASIPAPVMAGYLMLVCGTLLVEGRGW